MLELFGFTKSLEEIDQMDTPRLARALSARGYRDAWNKVEDMTVKFPGAEAMKKHLELTRLLNGT